MTSFLEDVVLDLQSKGADVSQITFVLPSKRAGVFLKELLSQQNKKTIFSPEILSIETLVETLSDLEYVQNTDLLFEFYDVYLAITPKEQQEPFDTFSKWAQILLQDFNEIDRYLISTPNLFNYLSAIKEISHWSLDKEQTRSVKNYISFWNRLPLYYAGLNQALLKRRKGYQGLVYREAVHNLEQFIAANREKKFVFIGFNALNKAEEIIIQELLQQDLASIYWDIDETFINDPIHDAGLFTRAYKAHWPYFSKHPFNWITKNYTTPKSIHVIGAPKQIGQVKYIGELLNELCETQKTCSGTAIVLGDENLLIPLLNSIPIEVGPLNITMGLPLKSIPMALLFEALFKLHKTHQKSIYYKDVVSIVSNPFVKPLFFDDDIDYSDQIIQHIQDNNVVYLNTSSLKTICKSKNNLIDLLFVSWNDSPSIAIQNSLRLILLIKQSISTQKSKNLLTLEYLYRFHLIFNELQVLNEKHAHINTINILYNLYKEIIANETLDFKGEPLKGLQIMGMLESRVLDFETVIICSTNEGILPAGKSNNSFIPFDVKLENGLPTYKEKDAVYTYHFYRLLQRAKQVYIVYNTEPNVLNGGEKSRFITQLEIENKHSINQYIVAPKVPSIPKNLKQIPKTKAILERLKIIAKEGFSPSSLTNYIRNPIDFYYEKVLGIKTFEEIEETVAANTLGTIVHRTLEDLYAPTKNRFLTEDDIKNARVLIEPTVQKHFKLQFKNGDFSSGKNLIIFEISMRYVSNFLNKELEALKKGNTIKILALEEAITINLDITELNFPVTLKGTVDRIDEFNGVMRIIDYKSGKVIQNQIEIVNWEDILSDYDKYSKSFQVLSYAYMLHSKSPFLNPVEGGIISFKNLQGDYFLKFAKKESVSTRTKDHLITQEILEDFFVQLKTLILEICNPDIPFTEKPIK
ncbi:PD-(D/E)XK nuclease family protein [Flavobacteriaceae bacterium LMO-SS05]